MTRKRQLTGFGIGVVIGVPSAWFIAGLVAVLLLKAPNANHDGHLHFVQATWIATAFWLGPYVLAGLVAAARAWLKAGRPGLYHTINEPVKIDLRERTKT